MLPDDRQKVRILLVLPLHSSQTSSHISSTASSLPSQPVCPPPSPDAAVPPCYSFLTYSRLSASPSFSHRHLHRDQANTASKQGSAPAACQLGAEIGFLRPRAGLLSGDTHLRLVSIMTLFSALTEFKERYSESEFCPMALPQAA